MLIVRYTLHRVDHAWRWAEPKGASTGGASSANARRCWPGGLLWPPDVPVFCRRDGQPIHASPLTRDFQAILVGAKLPRKRFHDLRHTCASLLIGRGDPLTSIQELFGHADYGLIRRVYAHLSDELRRDPADLMDGFLTGTER